MHNAVLVVNDLSVGVRVVLLLKTSRLRLRAKARRLWLAPMVLVKAP